MPGPLRLRRRLLCPGFSWRIRIRPKPGPSRAGIERAWRGKPRRRLHDSAGRSAQFRRANRQGLEELRQRVQDDGRVQAMVERREAAAEAFVEAEAVAAGVDGDEGEAVAEEDRS